MTIVGITGLPLAGKTTVASVLTEQGFEQVDMGDVVRDEMAKRNIPVEKTGDFVNEQREKHGMDAIARLTVPYIREHRSSGKDIVITGMRGWTEKELFEDEIDDTMTMVAVWAPQDERKRRSEERGRPEDVKGEPIHERDIRDIRNGVGKLLALSDVMIRNTGTIETLRQKVKQRVLEER